MSTMGSKLPHFVVKQHFQKKNELYSTLLTDDILMDICIRVTGSPNYTCEFDEEGYNKGRLVTLTYGDSTALITLSDTEAGGRNSSFQSVPTALNSFYLDVKEPKRICFYFLPSTGRVNSPYFIFMYRLMKTAGIELLNADDFFPSAIVPFISVDDMIAAKDKNRGKNSSNNSTYITLSGDRVPQIYGKTYGASKYETTLFAVALYQLVGAGIDLFEIQEKNLKELPARSLEVIESLGIRVIPTSITMERNEFEKNNSLRSPRYTYNLLVRHGAKKCAFCHCEIPEIIQGAHVWPVADIKTYGGLCEDEKIEYATDGDNGLWLCENHHALFDKGLIEIEADGCLKVEKKLNSSARSFINAITPVKQLPSNVLTKGFLFYLDRRNSKIGT